MKPETTYSREECIRQCEKWISVANTDEQKEFVQSLLRHLKNNYGECESMPGRMVADCMHCGEECRFQ